MAVAPKELQKMQDEAKKSQNEIRMERIEKTAATERDWVSYPPKTPMGCLAERILCAGSRAVWPMIRTLNKFSPGESSLPEWAPEPLHKCHQKSLPPLGWPRKTDSLCPRCVKEAREKIVSGEKDYTYLIDGKPGMIEADILERDGLLLMVKDCEKHGHFEEVLSIDPEFTRIIERRSPGRDFKSPTSIFRNHGPSSIQYGRGSVLTIDLTNRCNMMCNPCFTDANQVGYVHELTWEEIKEILDNSLKIKPRRQMSIQFSGGEPTLSPHFLKAIQYCKDIGYFSIQAATNGIRFAQDPGLAKKAYDAGMRIAYLQFDGVSNASNAHRNVTNLFDVKLRAITNLAHAGIDVVLVTTVINGINNDQVGKIIEFAIQNSDKITFCAFQPISFTGRDEDISDEVRAKQRYTLAHFAHDVKKQTGVTEPHRDWFPFGSSGVFSDLADMLKGTSNDYWGTMKCGCHPNCGVIGGFLVNKETREWKPLSEFIDLERLLNDLQDITDANRSSETTKRLVGLALLRNFYPDRAPKDFSLREFLRKFDKQSGGGLGGGDYGEGKVRKKDKWHFLFVGGMLFQDLFTYDFRRTEMCIIPYGTQLGEISFCAYNTGVGWRQIIESRFKKASVTEWHRKFGRHGVYAGDNPIPMPETDHEVSLPVFSDAEVGILPTYKSKVVES